MDQLFEGRQVILGSWLADERFDIQLDDDVIADARRALDRMLAVPRDN